MVTEGRLKRRSAWPANTRESPLFATQVDRILIINPLYNRLLPFTPCQREIVGHQFAFTLDFIRASNERRGFDVVSYQVSSTTTGKSYVEFSETPNGIASSPVLLPFDLEFAIRAEGAKVATGAK